MRPLPTPQPRPDRARPVLAFALVTAPFVLLNMVRLATHVSTPEPLAALWLAAALVVYASLAVLLVFVPLVFLERLLRVRWVEAAARRARIDVGWLAPAVALVAATALQLLLHVDVVVHGMYGFHLNGFVWNLVTTPGGIESLGASDETMLTFVATGLGILLLQAGLLAVAWRGPWCARLARRVSRPRALGTAFGVLVLLTAGERLGYGMADVRDDRSILRASRVVPFYGHTNIQNLAIDMGWMPEREALPEIGLASSDLDYPLRPLERAPGSTDWNVVWLVCESLRADAVDPEIMPETFAFAQRSLDFRHHYSGGNGTRMGVFSMFYGLYGAYWFPFLAERRGPVLVDLLLDAGYATSARTSARFSYPEFDATVWSRLPSDRLHEGDDGISGWENDRRHVRDLLAEIDARDVEVPFFEFMFFESAHARYYFPPESVVRSPYLEAVNYATLDLARDTELLHNRYLNSCHHLDQQLGRVFAGLEQRGLLDTTLVVVTGDHGEEFMEKGHWGHHIDFSEESTRVPLILHVPGVAPARVERLTSHLDIVPTIMARLGVVNPPEDYSLGHDLLGPFVREDCVVADWERLALVDANGKGVFPVRGSDFTESLYTDLDDRPVEDGSAWRAAARAGMESAMLGLSRFVR